MHQSKTYGTYNYFFSKLVSLNKDIGNVLVCGTDGEQSLYEASALQQEDQKSFLVDVFGRRIDDGRMGEW